MNDAGRPGDSRTAQALRGAGLGRVGGVWLSLRASLWFVPALLVTGGVLAALVLVEVEGRFELDLADRWPRLFGAGADGARGMLSAIATSMITVTGVVFSMTLVALSLAASQYSPRMLRNFMADRPTQVVLGAFVAVFAYCLIVLRTIRGGDDGNFVPSLAVLGGVVMAFVGIGLLIYFIHHVATSIQVSSMLARVADDTAGAIDRLFPSDVGHGLDPGDTPPPGLPTRWHRCEAQATGYLVGIDTERLLQWAAEHGAVVRVHPRVGDFVATGQSVLDVAFADAAPDTAPTSPPRSDEDPLHDARPTLLQTLALRPERDVHQDALFGVQQLVDVGLKALSPGVHDPSTAITCIDHLGALLRRLSQRAVPSPYREHEGRLRLIVQGVRYADLVGCALSSMTHHAASHVPVHRRLLEVIAHALDVTDDPARRRVLAQRLQAHRQRLENCDLPPDEARELHALAVALQARSRPFTPP